MKKTYDRKVFKRKLLSDRKTVTVTIRLFMILLLGFPLLTRAGTMDSTRVENREVRGKVIDEKKQPIPGVSVRLGGTLMGTATDVDGKFKLLIPADTATLVVSFIGMKTEIVKIPRLKTGVEQKELTIVLREEDVKLEDVVVTGIFTRKKESFTGSASTYSAAELKTMGTQNVLQSLKTLDPAFAIIEDNQFGSDPNRLPNMEIRGKSSMLGLRDELDADPNQPLFIVDGFEQTIEKVMDMDMNRVESITTLKDATAKALYGSKGANGVVVIETKRPAIGQMTVSYTGSLDIQAPDLSSYNLCDAWEKLEVERLSGIYTSSTNNPVGQQQRDELYQALKKEVERGVDTYWLSKPLRTGVGQKHSLNFEGGDEFIRYNVNVSYNNVAGVMKGSDRETYGGGFTFSYRYKSLLFREQLSLLHNKAENSPYGTFSDYAKLNPYWRTHNEDGTIREILNPIEVSYGDDPIYNPLINKTLNTKDVSKYTDITNNFYIEWNVFKDLKATGRIGFTSRTDESDIFYPLF